MVVESLAEKSQAPSGPPGQPKDQEAQPLEHVEAGGTQTWTPDNGIAIMADEDQLLLESTAPDGSPASDASLVTGHMAALQVNTPPREVAEDGDTSK